MDKLLIGFFVVLGVIALTAGFSLLFTLPLMWAINYTFTPAVLVGIFGVAKLTFWRTFIFSWLCASLFKAVQYNYK